MNQGQNFEMGEGVSKTAKTIRRLLWTAPSTRLRTSYFLNLHDKPRSYRVYSISKPRFTNMVECKKYEIWADFGSVGNTEKKGLGRL